MNKKVLIGIIIAVAVLLIGGGVFVLSNRSEEPEDVGYEEVELPKMDPEEIGLEIIPSSDKKYIQFKASKLDGIKHLEWEFTYDADAQDTGDGDSTGGRITQGFGGEEDVESKGEYISEKRELGTCSTGGKCRFDTGIEEVKLIIKVTKSDNKIYQVEDSITL